MKVSSHNLTDKTQSLTFTKVLPPEAPESEGELNENVIVPNAKETLQMGNAEGGSSTGVEESADGRVKRGSDRVVSEEAKRPKCG